jgi:hypothetical protein
MNATSSATWRTRAPLLAVGLVALALGLIARFKNLGAASLAVDEYFIVQSVRNVLHTGLPAFDCGGWYQRGLLLQYLSAGLQLLGISEPLAPRVVAALSSVIALPAVFAIGRRAYNPAVGLIAVSLLLVSVWEIEIARFGRMYMPFQAIAAWHAFYFIRYTMDRKPSALVAMALLSFLGILTWEGGVFLAAANFIPMFLNRDRFRFSPRFVATVIGLGVLVVFGYWLAVANLRVTSRETMLPPNYTGETFGEVSQGLFDLAPNYLLTIFQSPVWLALGLIPVAAAAFALRDVLRFRARPLAALGLLLALVAALCGQVLAVATVLVLLVVFQLVDWSELLGRSMRAFQLAVVVCTLFWLLFVAMAFHHDGVQAGSFVRTLALFGYQFAWIPNFVDVAIWPWARAVPVLGLVLFVALAAAVVRVTRRPGTEPLTAERALLALVLCMLVCAAVSTPPRIETRYTFFLYPLVVVLGVGTLWCFVAARLRSAIVAGAVATGATFAVFAVTEDFDVDHLLHVDRKDVLMRTEMSPNLSTHLVGHGDDGALVRWVEGHVVPGRDVVITGYHVLDYYYPNVSYFFVDHRDESFGQWSCRRGTTERWTNKPMLYTVEALEAAVPERGRVFLVVFDDGGHLLSELRGMSANIVWSKGGLRIIEIERT